MEWEEIIDNVIFVLASELGWSWEELLNMPLRELFNFFNIFKKKKEMERDAIEAAKQKRASKGSSPRPSRGRR